MFKSPVTRAATIALMVTTSAFMTAGCAGALNNAHAQQQAGPVFPTLTFDCNPARDPAIERAAQNSSIIPMPDGKPGYCIAKIDIADTPVFKSKSVYVLYGGKNLDNCGSLGCPIYAYLDPINGGALVEATPANTIWLIPDTNNPTSITYYKNAAKNIVALSTPYRLECATGGGTCPTVKDKVTGKQVTRDTATSIYSLDPKNGRFTPR